MNLLFEMARIGDAVRGRDILVDIVLHGGNDRIYPPHIHIYNTNERKMKSKPFTIEVNLAHLMWTGNLSTCRILDKNKGIDIKDSANTKWKGYLSYLDVIEDFLFSTEVMKNYSDCIDNIAVAIKVFNEEADLKQLRKEHKKLLQEKFGNIPESEKFIAVLYCYGKKIHKDFRKYFTIEQRQKYKDIF